MSTRSLPLRMLMIAIAAVSSSMIFPLHAQDPAPSPADPAAPVEAVVIPASETTRLLEMAGQNVTVEGRIARVGTSKDGGITFLNFSAERGGFVAVAFRANYDNFPDGFGVYQGKSVRMTGEIKPFQGSTPQLVLNSPDQVQVME